MESKKISAGMKFINSLNKRRRIAHFKSYVPASLMVIMDIKNEESRLSSLYKLLEEVHKDIDEISNLSELKRPIHENMTLDEYFCTPESPTGEPSNMEKDLAAIDELKEYQIPIVQEIARVQFRRSTLRKYSKKSIEVQFTDIFADSSNANKVIYLLKCQRYISTDDMWLVKSENKGEIKAAYVVLKDKGLLKKGKTTTQARIFYKRFKYDVVFNERTLRNELKDEETINGFKILFAPLFKEKSN